MTNSKAFLTAAGWVAIALAVAAWLFLAGHVRLSGEFLGAFCMEEALSLDNLFMFLLIFRSFHTPPEARPRVLRWGMLGVIVMRGAVILSGTELIRVFRPVLWIFAIFLFWSAWKILFMKRGEETSPEEAHAKLEANWLVRLSRRFLGFDARFHGDRFLATVDGKTRGTMLLLTLFVIEGTDLPFAFDSLPAAMAVSQNAAIVLSSNLLAVLSLRALYFVIENMQERFSHMSSGVGMLLALAGAKILLPDLGRIVNSTVGRVSPGIAKVVPPGFGIELPLAASLGAIVVVIAATITYTFVVTRGASAAPTS